MSERRKYRQFTPEQKAEIVSCDRFGGETLGRSVFIDWLAPVIETIRIDAKYWK